MLDLVAALKRILDEHHIAYETEVLNDNRYVFHWNQVMYDPGLNAANVILDYTVDAGDRDIYLGLIRIPPAFRGKGIGTELIEAIKLNAAENGYSILLESADENIDFWSKEQFCRFFHEDYGFWIMGYGGEGRQQWNENWDHIKHALYPVSPLPCASDPLCVNKMRTR